MPRPNRNAVFAMQLLIALEEQFNFRFRSKEVQATKCVTALIDAHHVTLLKRNKELTDRLDAVKLAAR